MTVPRLMKEPKQTTMESTKPQMPGKVTPAHGPGQLNTGGTPGNKGGGRLPNEFKLWMQEFASGPEAEKGIKMILETGPDHPLWLSILKYVTEYGYGRPNDVETATADNIVVEITANP